MRIKRTVIPVLIFVLLALVGCSGLRQAPHSFQSETLTVQPLSKNVYVHVSPLTLSSGAVFPCNGAIFVNGKEAIVCDTPVDDEAAAELILWIKKELKCKVTAVVVNHFHVDCLGGLDAFHAEGIPSYAFDRCVAAAQKAGKTVPQNSFNVWLELPLGKEKLINAYLGAGHTRDNIVSYYRAEKALFGGCMIKSLKAGKGNLEDADVPAWSNSVERVKSEFKEVEIVIPGHGAPGGPELLDYTIEMFAPGPGE